MARKIVIAGNWKMNLNVAKSVDLARELAEKSKGLENVQMVIAPTYLATASVVEAVKGSNIAVAVQDIHWQDQGAFTGKISVDMIVDLGVKYVILGHSEQRQYFNETDETVNLKTKKVLAAGLTPIVCIGETLEERNTGKMNSVLETQVKGAYAGISTADAARTIVAYEPVWAIGTGVVASDQQAQDAQAFVRSIFTDLYGSEMAQNLTIQYGGSMKPDNAEGLLAQSDVDGGLIGGASLKADSFLAIVKAGEKEVLKS
jgi:triosephosphate isomerase (TIM)